MYFSPPPTPFHAHPTYLPTHPLTQCPPSLCYHTEIIPSIRPTNHPSLSTFDRFLIFLNISHVPKVFLIHPRFFPSTAAAGAEITLPTTTTEEEAERGRRTNIEEREGRGGLRAFPPTNEEGTVCLEKQHLDKNFLHNIDYFLATKQQLKSPQITCTKFIF